MALGTTATAIASAAASSATQIGLSQLFGRESSGGSAGFNVPSLDAGGLSFRGGEGVGDAGFGVESSSGRQRLVGNIAATFPQQARLLAEQRALVAPGASALRASKLQQNENARLRAIGNLRENLSRRRVLGSSFAQDAATRSDIEFAQEAERIEAETFMQELELTNQLINQEFDVRRGEFETQLNELNLQAEFGSQLMAGATAQLGANSRLEAQLAAQSAQGAGQFFGQAIQPFADAVGQGASSIFSGGGGGGGVGPWQTTTIPA